MPNRGRRIDVKEVLQLDASRALEEAHASLLSMVSEEMRQALRHLEIEDPVATRRAPVRRQITQLVIVDR